MPPLRQKLSKVDDYPAFLDACWQEHLAPRAADAPTVVSTFAGAGGSSLGYSMAGFRELLAVEWDDNAVATFRLNFPDVPVYHGDIAKLSVEDVLQRTGLQPGQLDVFDGSPPCQGFSTAGKRDFYDDRNQLFREYVRLLRGLQPKVLIMENVSGMVKGKMKLVFADILRELKASGYRVSARLLNAMYFNVPQSRQRMIFVGVREDLGIEPSHPQAVSVPVTVGAAIGNLPNVMDEAKQHYWNDEAGRTQNYPKAEKARQGEKYRLTYRREVWDSPAATLTKPGIGKPYLANSNCHPIHTRTYSLRESARLASFGDGFTFAGKWEGWDRIGNSVPPLLMRSVALHVRREILSRVPVLVAA
jgi:DNA (cytosine-5)-methyltransferase 1